MFFIFLFLCAVGFYIDVTVPQKGILWLQKNNSRKTDLRARSFGRHQKYRRSENLAIRSILWGTVTYNVPFIYLYIQSLIFLLYLLRTYYHKNSWYSERKEPSSLKCGRSIHRRIDGIEIWKKRKYVFNTVVAADRSCNSLTTNIIMNFSGI